MNHPYVEDPPETTLPRRAAKELKLHQAKAWQHGGLWFVSGYVNRKLRIYCPDGKGWEEITVGGEER